MGKGAKAGVTLLWACACMAAVAGPAFAQNKELSDKSVLTLMRYAWGMVPEKFTTPLGKTIIVDKSHASEAIVPLDIAREVIRVARMSAYAQLCELPEEQRANYQTLMRREEAKSKWSDQQMLFINQLHLFTVMTLTGKVQLVEKDGDKQVVVQEGKPAKTEVLHGHGAQEGAGPDHGLRELRASAHTSGGGSRRRLLRRPPSAPSRPPPARRSEGVGRNRREPHCADATHCASGAIAPCRSIRIDAPRRCAITRARAGPLAPPISRLRTCGYRCRGIGNLSVRSPAPGRGGSARHSTLQFSHPTLECHA